MRSLGLVLLLARARGAIQGLKGVACVNPMYSNGLDGCVFANDNTREVCWLDLASREAFLMPGDYDRPHEVAITRDGSLVVVADWYGGTLTKITPNDAGAGATNPSACLQHPQRRRRSATRGAYPKCAQACGTPGVCSVVVLASRPRAASNEHRSGGYRMCRRSSSGGVCARSRCFLP